MKVSFDEGVFEELVNMSVYLAEDNKEIAHKFLDACNATFQFLADNRKVGSIRKFESVELSEIRMWRVKGFEKYLIFYVPTVTGIRILHLLHSATDYNRAFEND